MRHRAPDIDLRKRERCEVCEQPLDGREPYWIVEHPRGVHQSCRDWSAVAFPYARDVGALRRLVRRVRRATSRLIAIGRRLAAIDREWPAGGVDALVESRKLLEQAREEAAALGLELPRSTTSSR